MYTLVKSGKETLVFYPRPQEGATVSFTLNELDMLIHRLLFRKERNNGVGRMLMSRLRLSWHGFSEGQLRYTLPNTLSGFVVRPSFSFKDRFELVLFGDTEALVGNLNGRPQSARQDLPRQPREAKPRVKRQKLLRALPGASGGLHWHFRNHDLTWDAATLLLAKASGNSVSWVRRKLYASLDERGVASVRFSGEFVARIDLGISFYGLLNTSRAIELRTTDNNRNPMYRKLRSLLKVHFDCEPRTRQRAQAAYHAARREARLWRYG